MTGFLIDLWEFVDCDYCGAKSEEMCRTRNGMSTTRSHSPRIVFIEDDSDDRSVL